ncbi:NIPSNAP family protein [Pseudonocardia humida]|uniref:NIPSNAP family protein n=1 Tax=Pseudonocardia humida TaxID=2800819 RepID=A0ABT1ADL6_9PSEU|nr:NIPSNAP family protein [Pseudonocardia humida]MCO1660679.1 NIPSNAP family protein [Pseudonocardia humida]
MFYEIRTEHARPGRGTELARYMDETVIPLHQEMGMRVVGAFTVIGDEDAFVWVRRFEDATDRDRILDAVHRHPRCAAVIDTVSALVGRAETVVRLEPTPGSGLH